IPEIEPGVGTAGKLLEQLAQLGARLLAQAPDEQARRDAQTRLRRSAHEPPRAPKRLLRLLAHPGREIMLAELQLQLGIVRIAGRRLFERGERALIRAGALGHRSLRDNRDGHSNRALSKDDHAVPLNMDAAIVELDRALRTVFGVRAAARPSPA